MQFNAQCLYNTCWCVSVDHISSEYMAQNEDWCYGTSVTLLKEIKGEKTFRLGCVNVRGTWCPCCAGNDRCASQRGQWVHVEHEVVSPYMEIPNLNSSNPVQEKLLDLFLVKHNLCLISIRGFIKNEPFFYLSFSLVNLGNRQGQRWLEGAGESFWAL